MPRGQKCGADRFVEHELHDFVLKRNRTRLKVLLAVKTSIKHLCVVQGEKPETFVLAFCTSSLFGAV